jgi:hypothetical protein
VKARGDVLGKRALSDLPRPVKQDYRPIAEGAEEGGVILLLITVEL